MLSLTDLERILNRLGDLTIGVLGDLFLDRYLEIDPRLTEKSIETGLDAYQVVRVRPSPGAAGTIINNLVALGVKRVVPIAVIGDDGEGYELRQCLAAMPTVDCRFVFSNPTLRTPTYTKPLLCSEGSVQELNRLAYENRRALPADAEQDLLSALRDAWPGLDALIVQDQVSEPDCGVVTTALRRELALFGESQSEKFVLADSRERIGLFRSVCAKPNEQECTRATPKTSSVEASAQELAEQLGRPVFCTRGDKGIHVVDPRPGRKLAVTVPAFPVTGPIDVVGAGDSCNAAMACGMATGSKPLAAAAFGNLVASITIQQLGTTGTATPNQVRERYRHV